MTAAWLRSEEGEEQPKFPRIVYLTRRSKCCDCGNVIYKTNPSAKVNGNRVCEWCAQAYVWSAAMGRWEKR